jgi:hypothetical protein
MSFPGGSGRPCAATVAPPQPERAETDEERGHREGDVRARREGDGHDRPDRLACDAGGSFEQLNRFALRALLERDTGSLEQPQIDIVGGLLRLQGVLDPVCRRGPVRRFGP